jgi:TonB family protein
MGSFWVGQQTQLNQFARADRNLAWIHIAFLCASTSQLAEFLHYRIALSGASAPPVTTLSSEPGYPTGAEGNKDPSVLLALVVDTQGKPQDLKVSQSGGKAFEEEAFNTVQKWGFKPATCDGEPMPVEIRVQVNFSHEGVMVTPRH